MVSVSIIKIFLQSLPPSDIEYAKVLPSLQKVAGEDNVQITKAVTGGEDFSYFQEVVPGVYFFLGGMEPGTTEAFPHHTPDFKIDDKGMLLGVKAFTQMTLDYLNNH